jgi:aspartate aminotransferase-like enzyme
MRKKYILAPGPTPIPPEVLAEGGMPILHHRTPQYQAIFKDAHEGLRMFFRTKQPVMTFASVGTGAMESAVSNLTSPGERILVASAGHFGNRWAEIAKAYQVEPDLLEAPWGKAVDPAEVRKRLKASPGTKLVFTTLNETSTGVVNDVKALAEAAHEAGALLVVDAISGLGAVPCETDAWGLDLVLSGSQKGFMIPPGLAFVCASPAAVEKTKSSKNPRYYFSYEKALKKLTEGELPDTPFTPAISLVVQVRKALELIREEGLEKVWERHAALGRAVRAGVQALGLELFAPTAPSNALTSVVSPEGIDSGKINKTFRDVYGVSIAGGQGKMKGKIFRIGHLGYVDGSDAVLGVATLERTLHKLGKKVPLGAGVKAVQEVLLEAGL